MKVLLITSQIIKVEGDSCYCIANFHDIVKRLERLGTVSICAQRYTGKSTNVIDTKLDIIPPSRVSFLKKSRLIPNSDDLRTLDHNIKQADLVIGYNPSTYGELALFYAKKYHKKYMTILVACPWDGLWNHSLAGKCVAPFKYLLNRYVTTKSDYVLYVTNEFLQRRYPNKKINIGCSDVRISSLDSNIIEARLQRVVVTNAEIKLITAGSVEVRFKGQQYVIKALRELKKCGLNNYHYYLAGGGDNSYLKTLAIECGVTDNVHFLGAIPHADMNSCLDSMDIYIQPSLQEGLPRALVEAMSRGLTCIGARTAAIPELLDPDYIVERKSIRGIVEKLKNITIDDMKVQSVRNFEESKKYYDDVISKRRNGFFDAIIHDINPVI